MKTQEQARLARLEIQDADLASKAEIDAALAKIVNPPGEPLPNARRFIAAEFFHPERFLLVHQGGAFYVWDGTCWPELDAAELRTRLYSYFDRKEFPAPTRDGKTELRPFAPTRHKVADLVDAMKAVAHIAVTTATPSWLAGESEYPADELISCQNGLVHWPTRTLLAHTPLFFAHHSVEFEFDPGAPPPSKWFEFLSDLWGDDQEMIETLQELFGYMVAGDTRLQKIFLLVGPKRSGKGTIARIARGMLGNHNVAGPTLAGLGTNFGLSPLIGKPVAIVADARLRTGDSSIVTERLLSISGEDVLTVDRKYREPWTGQLLSRFVILTNELPRLSDSSGALASRFVVLTMTRSFYNRENTRLTQELLEELPGIFNWALVGLQRLRDRGYFRQPAASMDAIRELEDLGSPVGAFIRDECLIGPEYRVSVDTLYSSWKVWCEAAGRSRPSTAQVFGRDLRAAVPGVKIAQPRNHDGSRHREYVGIGLARDGTRTHPLYLQHETAIGRSIRRPTNSPDHNRAARVPVRADDFSSMCPKCDGAGCGYCGDTGRWPEDL